MNLTPRDTIFRTIADITHCYYPWIRSNAVTSASNINMFYNLIIIGLIILLMFVSCAFCNQTWNM
jgi:hypothetical protein